MGTRGSMAAMIAARDWSDTPFGPREAWPTELSVVLDLCLDLRFPAAVYWGPDFRALYNDANAEVLADRHPGGLGQPAREMWPEVWERLGEMFGKVVADGRGLAGMEAPLLVRREARFETVWLNYSFTPIRDRTGTVLGLFAQAIDATDSFLAKEALVSSEARLSLALTASNSVGTWDWDVQANRATADPRFAALLGVPAEDMTDGAGRIGHFLKRVHPDDRATLAAAFDRTLHTGEDFDAEYRIHTASGDERWLVARGRCTFADGKPVRFSGVSFEFTQRKRAEQAVRRAKEERDFVLNLTEQQRAQPDADGILQITAEAMARRYGASRAGFFRVIDEETLEYDACWTDGSVAALVGRVGADKLGQHVRSIARRGMTLVFGDLHLDPQVRDSDFAVIDARAGIGVPLVRGGAWNASFYITEAHPRIWTPEEVGLAEEVAQLSWDAVARVSALTELRERNRSLAGQIEATVGERDRLWEASRDLLGIADVQAVFVNANPSWTRLLGWPVEDIVGQTTEWIEHPDDRARTRAEVARLAAVGDSFGFENRLRTVDGNYRTLSWTAARVENHIYCTGRDVTAEREQQAALRQAEELSRLAMESVNGVGTWSYDIATDRMVTNTGFAALYGIAPERAASGMPMAEAMRNIHPDDLDVAAAKLAANRTVGFAQSEYRLLGPDGSIRWVLSRTHTSGDASGAAVTAIGVVLDVTEQRGLEEQLRQAQKMEAVGQLTGGLAHDFNNLLTGISGALEMMHVRLKQGRHDAISAYVDAAQGASRRAAALTHRLLAFSRRQTLDPRPTDVNRLIGEIEELVRRTAGPGVEVVVDADPALAPALIDANQLENALLNLCINARDAMAGNGTIRITTRNVTLEDGTSRDLEVEPGDYLRLDIADTGKGMSAQVIARAFDPFFTTKPMGEGTGLGLSMIYGFARQSGGQIAIASREGRGTTMSLYLPRHVGPSEVAPVDQGAAVALSGHGQTVLVVDDEPGVRMLVREALTELHYTVIEAEDGAGAVAILNSDVGIDLLVTDVGLPGGINGRQVADAARAARPALGVLFITGYAEHAVIGNAPLEAGMALLTKPFTIEALGARVAEMVAR